MKRVPSIRIYALAVCFVSVICIAITAGFALYNLIALAAPDLTIEPYRIQYLSSNTEFVNNQGFYPRPAPIMVGPDGTAQAVPSDNPFEGMTDAQITDLRLEKLQNEYTLHRRSATLSLLREGIIILISSVLFFIHWRLAKNIGTGIPKESESFDDEP